MAESFAALYSDTLKDVFVEKARQQVAQGDEALATANAYAEQGKPEFALAFLLLSEVSDEVKRDIFARSYEQHAAFSEKKAASFDAQFHRPFPLITLEAQKDRRAAQYIREGKPLA